VKYVEREMLTKIPQRKTEKANMLESKGALMNRDVDIDRSLNQTREMRTLILPPPTYNSNR